MPRIISYAELEASERTFYRKATRPDLHLAVFRVGLPCLGQRRRSPRLQAGDRGQQGLNGQVDFRSTGCHGFCERGPIVVIHPEEICYLQVSPRTSPRS